ncbi:MAG: hypothetical protein ABEJ96_01640 [Thiohalorhabdaceae bacterium]
MSEDGKTMQERLETILRESRYLAQDAGRRVASFSRWAYQDVMRRLGLAQDSGETPEVPTSAPKAKEPTPETGTAGETASASEKAAESGQAGGETTPEGYAVGQVWTPKDASKKSRKVVEVKAENGEYYLVWQSQEGGKKNRIKEDSFTRWVRRENAQLKG